MPRRTEISTVSKLLSGCEDECVPHRSAQQQDSCTSCTGAHFSPFYLTSAHTVWTSTAARPEESLLVASPA